MSEYKTLNKTINPKGFDSVFSEVSSRSLNLKNNNCLRLFQLEIRNSQFIFDGLHLFLQKNIGRYVFSRATLENFRLEGEEETVGLKAIELLRTAKEPRDNGAGGELGEILLYLFLEHKLDAPKLLSKVELKTSGNQYVFGSDGIHLLKVNGKPFPSFQLIFGESKIKGDLKDAVDTAFKSIKGVSDNPANEIRLIEKNIFAETFDKDTYEFIRSLIVPSNRDLSVNVDNAFGIFIGYTLDIDSSKYTNEEFRSAAYSKMQDDIILASSHIEKKINDTGLSGYSFYIYIIPFNNAAEDRGNIIRKLKGGE